jgi:hypothetical protein
VADQGQYVILVDTSCLHICSKQFILDFRPVDLIHAPFGLTLTILYTQKSLPYPFLSDRKRVLIGALGAADGAKTKRSHFVFGKDGTLRDKKLPVKPADSPRLALEFVKGLASE